MKSLTKIQYKPATSNFSVGLTRRIILTASLIILSLVSHAAIKEQIESKAELLEKRQRLNAISIYFDKKISDLDATLLNNKEALTTNHLKQREFVDQKLLPLWSAKRTLRLMVGSKQWKAFSKEQKSQLEGSFNETFHRYMREGLKFYDGQRIKVLSVKINRKETKGHLTAELSPIYLPSFNITFKIANEDDRWKLYDIMIEGISYIQMKKNEYRRILHEQNFDALICHLDKKNSQDIPESLAKTCDKAGLGCRNVMANCG
ncbi:MAG: ABC transporter substrate-binding protein [Kangiellaceae bacterium]|nr:ABC transporter substrate-binding protein [Kangiellaceae bacterium]